MPLYSSFVMLICNLGIVCKALQVEDPSGYDYQSPFFCHFSSYIHCKYSGANLQNVKVETNEYTKLELGVKLDIDASAIVGVSKNLFHSLLYCCLTNLYSTHR